MTSVGLGILFQARDEATEVSHKLKEALHGLHEQAEKTSEGVFTALAKGAGVIGATATAVAGIGTAAAFEFAEHAERFSSSLKRAGIAAHATVEELEGLEDFAKGRMLDSISESAIDVAESLKQLDIEGFNAEQAAQALDGTMNLVKVSMGALDSRSAAGIVNDTLGQFGMQADEASELVDKLAFSMQHFGFRAEELQGTMSGLAAGAHLTGSSLDDVLIGVGLVKQIFPSATKSAMAMNVAMTQLADAHHQQLIASTLGINVVDQHTKKLRPLVEIMRDLSDKTAKMSEAQLSHTLETIAGGRAAGGLSAIIDGLRKGVVDETGKLLTGAAALEFYRKGLNESGGAAKEMSEALDEDLGGAIRALKNAISNVGVLIGEQFEGKFTNAVHAANLAVRGLTQLFAQGGFSGEVLADMDKAGNGGIKNFAIQIFLWVSRIENFFSSFKKSFGETFERFTPIMKALGDAFMTLGQALGIVSQTADQNASKFDAFGAAGETVGSIVANVAGILSDVLLRAVQLITGAVYVLTEAWEAVGPAVKTTFQILKGVFEIVGALITSDWEGVWKGLVDVVFGAMKGVVQIFGGAMKSVTKILDELTGNQFSLTAKVEAQTKASVEAIDQTGTSLKNPGKTTADPGLAAFARQEAFRRKDNADSDARPSFLEPPVQHIHTHVHMDGQKMAEALHKVKRNDDQRSFKAGDDRGGVE